ncbi:MAG: hypothetical protein RL226_865, partial [Bacteroidota bacterium]
MLFSDLGLPAYFLKALSDNDYNQAYPIQQEAIPAILAKRDVLGIAQTGAGKTIAYVLPVLMNLEGRTITKNRHINVLTLVPTRELAIQVEEVFHFFGATLPYPFKSLAVHGGVSINPQMIAMQHVNVLVATPGRLLELVGSNALHFDSLSTLILDEADKMLNLGFKAEMDKILDLLPKKRQNLLFSATLSPEIQNIEKVLLHDPLVINVVPESAKIEFIQQTAYHVEKERKGGLLRYLIKTKEMHQVLVFTSSVYQADLVTKKLLKNGIQARAIHSEKSQGSRNEALNDFKHGRLRVLVATDLLSRGVDIELLPYVINYELPRSPKDFIHRIGRTGRAENLGECITFVSEDDLHHFDVIQRKMNVFVEISPS